MLKITYFHILLRYILTIKWMELVFFPSLIYRQYLIMVYQALCQLVWPMSLTVFSYLSAL